MSFLSCSPVCAQICINLYSRKVSFSVLEMLYCKGAPLLSSGELADLFPRFYPTISIMPHWFDRRRGLALGIVVAGSSVGGICWPFMLQRLFQQVGFAWAVRIAGFICLAILAPSCFLITPRLRPRKSTAVTMMVVKTAFTDKRYLLLIAGMFFIYWGMFIPFYYLPAFGLANGMSLNMSENLLATLNAGSFVGRIASGVMADKLGRFALLPLVFQGHWTATDADLRFNVTLLCALCAGITLMCLHAIKTATAIIAFSVLYGGFTGGLISLQSACVGQFTSDISMIGIKIGLLMAICSFGYVFNVVYTES